MSKSDLMIIRHKSHDSDVGSDLMIIRHTSHDRDVEGQDEDGEPTRREGREIEGKEG